MIRDPLDLALMMRRRRLPAAALAALQLRRLRALLRHAYDNVPYYGEQFRRVGVTPEDIRSLEDLRHVPVSTKADLRDAGFERCVARGVDPARELVIRSSGTTGEPFAVVLSRREGDLRRLDGFRALSALGLRPRDRLVALGPTTHHHGRSWHHRLGFYDNQNISSALDVDEQIDRLRRLQPSFLSGYPSALRPILRRLGGRLSAVVRPRTVVLGAEPITADLVRDITADLGQPIFNFYGAVETGPIAVDCRYRRGLHLHADRLVVEFDGDASPGEDGRRPAIVTVLDGLTMPLIRYRLGDLIAFEPHGCACGSGFPLIKPPAGRDWALLRLADGRPLTAIPLTNALRDTPGVVQFRIVQDRLAHLRIELVLEAVDATTLLANVQREIAALLPREMSFELCLVDGMLRAGGKHQAVVSMLPESEDDRRVG